MTGPSGIVDDDQCADLSDAMLAAAAGAEVEELLRASTRESIRKR